MRTLWPRRRLQLAVHCALAVVVGSLAVTGASLASGAVPGPAPDVAPAEEPPDPGLSPGNGEPAPPPDAPEPSEANLPEAAPEPAPAQLPDPEVPPSSQEPALPEAQIPEAVAAEGDGGIAAPAPVADVRKDVPAQAEFVKELPAEREQAAPEGARSTTRGGESDEGRARIASHEGFVACHGVPPAGRDECEQILTRLLDEELRICTEARRLDSACREASVRFGIEAACIDQPDRDACRARLRSNPCFVDPLSGACDRSLVLREVRACRAESGEIISFECRVLGSALQLFCLEHQAAGIPVDVARCPQAGGGSEETDRPGARGESALASAGGAGGGRSVLVGLTDPGSRGDVGLRDEPAPAGEQSKPGGKLARTGLGLPGLVLAGLLLAAGGLTLRRRVPARG